MARFQPALSDEQALRAAGKAAKQASPEDPLKATQKQFDQARGAYEGLPSARALCQRFQLSWPQLLRAATSEPGQQTRQASYGRRDTSRKGIALDDCIEAIRRVARKNNRSRLTRGEYGHLRDQMSSRSTTLPTLNQVDQVLAREGVGWLQALKRAGLDSSRHPPKTGWKRVPWSSDDILQGLRRAQELLDPGEQLTQRKLKELAKEHDDVPGWTAVYSECKEQGVGFADLKVNAINPNADCLGASPNAN